MNTEVDFSPSSPQAAWLERELSAIDRSKTPWVILGGHRPGIIDSTDGPDDRETAPGMKNPSDLSVMDELQRDVWPLLVKYGVDLAFWGHNHVYQRSCAWLAIGQGSFNASDGCVSYSQKGDDGVATYVEPTAPVSVVVGTGGAKHTKNGLGQPFVEKAFHEFGYIRLTAVDATRLRATYREAGSGENGKVLDEFVVVKTRPITDSKSSVADQLEKALVSARTHGATRRTSWRCSSSPPSSSGRGSSFDATVHTPRARGRARPTPTGSSESTSSTISRAATRRRESLRLALFPFIHSCCNNAKRNEQQNTRDVSKKTKERAEGFTEVSRARLSIRLKMHILIKTYPNPRPWTRFAPRIEAP